MKADLPAAVPAADAGRIEVSAVRKFLQSRGNSALADRLFHWLMVVCALSVFGIVVLILSELILRSSLAWHSFGFKFFFQTLTRIQRFT